MKTVLTRVGGATVEIADNLPVVAIGEKINPTGKKSFAEELRSGRLERVALWTKEQARAGAKVIDVNVAADGVVESELLPDAVRVAMENCDLPLSIDSNNVSALDRALSAYEGKAILNSTTGEDRSLEAILPVAKEHGAAIIGLCYGDGGIKSEPEQRLRVAEKIINRAVATGIAAEDVILDPLAMPASTDALGAANTLEAIQLIRRHLENNLTLGVSNTSYGLPGRASVNLAMLTMAIALGVNCPITDPTRPEIRRAIRAADLLTGRDEFGMGWIKFCRDANQ